VAWGCCWSRLARPANLKHPPQNDERSIPAWSNGTPAGASNTKASDGMQPSPPVTPPAGAFSQRMRSQSSWAVHHSSPNLRPGFCQVKLSVPPATETSFVSHTSSTVAIAVFLSFHLCLHQREVVYILLADSHSLQSFLLIKANQANAPATDCSPTASIDAADRLEILSNSVQYHTDDSIDVI
jgi:hypothetical protein